MQRAEYDSIVAAIVRLHYPLNPEPVAALFPHVTHGTLGAIISQQRQRHTRATFGRHTRPPAMRRLLERYDAAVAASQPLGVLLRLAVELQLPPALLAKSVLGERVPPTVGERSSPTGGGGGGDGMPIETEAARRRRLNALLRCGVALASSACEPRLAAEVRLCAAADSSYGPSADAVKRAIGLEHEVRLAAQLRALNVAFFDEHELRRRGYDKTPDFLLDVPVAVRGCVVNWIESKASFGDDVSHRDYMREQYVKYWRRYGPGLVIYWFGFLSELIAESSEQHVLLAERLCEEDIEFMQPELNLVSSPPGMQSEGVKAPTTTVVRRSLTNDMERLSVKTEASTNNT